VSVEADWTIMFLDGVEVWRTQTPPQHKQELGILVNLALGGGWPITNAPSPSYMYVDCIRAYKRTGS
ncbi:MAG: glycoside hydrolase family 16 protein, partial [Asticcacaulis sp.]